MARYWKDRQIGIVGGGQLARMLQEAAFALDVDLHFLDPGDFPPVAKLSSRVHRGDWQSAEAIEVFGAGMDAVGIEFEAISTEGIRRLENQGVACYPSSQVLEIIQDKWKQKCFLEAHGLPTAPFRLLEIGEPYPGHPCVVKMRKGGYDGYGVKVFKESTSPLNWPELSGELMLEALADIAKELSVMVARFPGGAVRVWDPVEMVFHPEAHMLAFQLSPAHISVDIKETLQGLAMRAAEQLNVYGLLAVEFFLLKDGRVWINEMAPRPHNSGHTSIENSITSQFEQYLRVLLGLPPGATHNIQPAATINLLGAADAHGKPLYKGMEAAMEMAGVSVHLYGKSEVKPFRKMGHITLRGSSSEELLNMVSMLMPQLRVVGS